MSRSPVNLPEDRERLLRSAKAIAEADARMKRLSQSRGLSEQDMAFAEENRLPAAFFDFFELKRA